MMGIICIRFTFHGVNHAASIFFRNLIRPAQSAVHPWLRRPLTVQPAAAKSSDTSEHKKAPEGAIFSSFPNAAA
jgi:hypothetical protein